MQERSQKYKKIGQRLIRTLPELKWIREMGVRIAYLSSDEEKKKNKRIIHAECTKVDEKYQWCCRYDFFITVYEPNIEYFTEEQIDILIEHELRHVGLDVSGKEPKYYIVPHDIEEFWSIIDKYGLHWDANQEIVKEMMEDAERKQSK